MQFSQCIIDAAVQAAVTRALREQLPDPTGPSGDMTFTVPAAPPDRGHLAALLVEEADRLGLVAVAAAARATDKTREVSAVVEGFTQALQVVCGDDEPARTALLQELTSGAAPSAA